MFCGNHGWSSGWHCFDAGSIVRYLGSCRYSNMEPEIGYLQVSDDRLHNRPISEDNASYFAQNVARRLQTMS